MRFLTFADLKTKNEYIGVFNEKQEKIFEINSFNLSKKYIDMNDLIKNFSEIDYEKIRIALSENKIENLKIFKKDEFKILPPIRKTVHDIICAGFNYMDHLKEIKKETSSKPLNSVYFIKRTGKVIGPDDEIDSHSDINSSLDYEVELGVIIGKGGYKISVEEAEEHIFGYTIINDISSRELQGKYRQWFIGKSLDTFTSMGPVIVYKDELKMPFNLEISSYINGEKRQNSSTNLMITGVREMIAEISQGITLEAGDIISTGTCSGVGVGFNPPKYMKSKDVVECKIEKIGTLKNIVK